MKTMLLLVILKFALLVKISECHPARTTPKRLGSDAFFPESQCASDSKDLWNYATTGSNGPDYWGELFPTCYGKSQSPVDIVSVKAKRNVTLSKLQLKNYELPVKSASVMNNAHSVVVTPQDGVVRSVEVEGRTYVLTQLHFHWGDTKFDVGSEHKLDGKKYIMEAHLVHETTDKKTAVVGFFLQYQFQSSAPLEPIVKVLPLIKYKGQHVHLETDLNLNKLLPENPASFYRYTGSLTTPDCKDGVVWSFLKKNGRVGQLQMSKFTSLYTQAEDQADPGCRLVNNFRPVQPLNGRQIYSSQ